MDQNKLQASPILSAFPEDVVVVMENNIEPIIPTSANSSDPGIEACENNINRPVKQEEMVRRDGTLSTTDTALLNRHVMPWPDKQKLGDCTTLGGKVLYCCTCCNYRFSPGCDERGDCYWNGNEYSDWSIGPNGYCSCFTPFVCCCCPCCLLLLSAGCRSLQNFCRGVKFE